MTSQRWILAVFLSLASVLGTAELVTTETQTDTCRTFGSGVVQPFNGSSFYVRSNCPFTLTRFTHNRVECDITTRRDDSGLLVQVEIIINKVRTVLTNGSILVEKKSVSLLYDHTYQHIFQYGIYTKLRSSLLPLSITWHNVPGGIDTAWVEVEQELSADMTGLCGNNRGNKQQLIKESELADDTCQTRDPVSVTNQVRKRLQCMLEYVQLCDENTYGYEKSKYISCAFFKEVVQQCGNSSYVWTRWRSETACAEQICPGDLVYVEQGPAFVPSCSNLNPRLSSQDLTSSCVCPNGKVLNDRAVGFHCVSVSSCPCVFAGKSYSTGDVRGTKCQTCTCDRGTWQCSKNFCPNRCLIEGPFVTTYVDPEPYYHACVQEACSCELEGKFLGFCTAVAAYAEACSDQDVCVNWRTPDLCLLSKSMLMPPTTFTTKVSTSEGFTNATTTELTTPEESGTTKETYYTSIATTPTETKFKAISAELMVIIETGPPLTSPTSGLSVCSACKDLKRNKTWCDGEKWTEDCYDKSCRNGTIESTPVVCPEPTIPVCPRQLTTKVQDGCCETWKCDCRCELYGHPHYISFQGVNFNFMDNCTYILMEERSPLHNLTIAVDNFDCVPGIEGSCAKGIILKYQNSTATLTINPDLFAVQTPGWRFETTGYMVSIYLPEIRSYVSLSPYYTLVVSLAMEHFLNNTQGQCGVCGVGSCVRKGGQIEDDSCCDKTAYDWVYPDPLKPACASAPRNVPCHPVTTPPPTNTPTVTTSCPGSRLCELLNHPCTVVFSECRTYVNLILKKSNCEFDSCRSGPCSSLEQAADECKNAGFCVDWRNLTNGRCDVPCPEGLVFRECQNKLDDVCDGIALYPGAVLEKNAIGSFCPSGQFRAGPFSNICVSDCPYCKGPLGEPRLPGEVWQSGCNLCTCNNQTRTEECLPKPPEPAPICSPDAVLVNTSCCGDQTCVEKTCRYHEKTYKVGDRWKDAAHSCISFSCSKEGIKTETRVCPKENCQEEDRIWDDEHCCFTCIQSCAPKVTSINVTVDNCTTIMQMPACQGQCMSEPRVVLQGGLQVEQKHRCCRERSSERRSVTLQCFDLTTRFFSYRHVTSCECRGCGDQC
ncbi:mucin-5B [Micropterus dolomieu]|uniref:mucin-5B n=1 Tax=Micropterus dolomieu TaxID=147949 RepID=UPI001E8D9476|nr:mucin-5B [Micropterus dolomieu]